jgi:hypothetical protein
MKKIFLLCIVSIIAFSLFGCPEKQKTEEERIRITIEQKKEEPAKDLKKETESKPAPKKEALEKPRAKTLPPSSQQEMVKRQPVEEGPSMEEIRKKQEEAKRRPIEEEPRFEDIEKFLSFEDIEKFHSFEDIEKPKTQKREFAKKQDIEKEPSLKEIRERLEYEKRHMIKKGLLPGDVPGVSENMKQSTDLMLAGKYREASILLDAVHEKVGQTRIDKEFVDRKIKRLAVILRKKYSPEEAEERIRRLKEKIGNTYDSGDYSRVNEYLNKVILELKREKEDTSKKDSLIQIS